MEQELKKLKEEFREDLAQAKSPKDLQELRVKYLGRKAGLTLLFSKIPALAKEKRGHWGRELNSFKEKISSLLQEKLKEGAAKEEKIDLTFPAASIKKGSRHIISQVNEAICEIFEKLGFAIIEGDEIEDEWHNFTALNFPLDHPSRDAFDTFYLDLPASGIGEKEKSGGRQLLRCHTSPSQIRIMRKTKPPIAAISPGRVYRPDEVDATHSFMFHQIEGFAVDTHINFAHLKGLLSRQQK